MEQSHVKKQLAAADLAVLDASEMEQVAGGALASAIRWPQELGIPADRFDLFRPRFEPIGTVATHQPSVLSIADRVLWIEKGAVAEQPPAPPRAQRSPERSPVHPTAREAPSASRSSR